MGFRIWQLLGISISRQHKRVHDKLNHVSANYHLLLIVGNVGIYFRRTQEFIFAAEDLFEISENRK